MEMVSRPDLVAEDAELQAALGHVDLGLGAHHVPVGLRGHLQQLGVRAVGELGRVQAELLDRDAAAGQGGQGPDPVQDLVLARGDAAVIVDISRAPSSVGRIVPRLLELSTMPGHQAPAQHPVGDQAVSRANRAVASAEKTCSGASADSSSSRSRRLGPLVLAAQRPLQLGDDLLDACDIRRAARQDDLGVRRDRVVLGAAVRPADPYVVLGEDLGEHPGQHQDGVRPLQVDVELAVPADQAANLERPGRGVRVGHRLATPPGCRR